MTLGTGSYGQCLTSGLTSTNPDPSNSPQHTAYSSLNKKLYVSGNFYEETLDFDGLQVNNLATEVAESTLFIMQFSEDGHIEWMHAVGQSYSIAYSGRMLPLDDGVLACFRFNDTIQAGGTFIASEAEQSILIKYNLAGDVVWSNQFTSNGATQTMGLAEDEDGNLYVLGLFTEDVTVGGQTIQATGNPQELNGDLFLSKFDSNGEVVWLHYLGGGLGIDFPISMTYHSGQLFATGFFAGHLLIGEDNLTATSSNNTFVSCIDTSGTVIWNRQLSSDRTRPTDLAIFNDQLVVSGYFKNELTIGQTTLVSNGGPSEGFIVSFELNGDLNIVKNIGGVISESVDNIVAVNDNILLIAGHSDSESFELDGFSFSNPDLNPQNTNDNMFFAACDTNLLVTCFDYLESSLESRGFIEHVSAETIFLVGGYGSDLPIGDTTLYANGGSTFVAKTCMPCNELIALNIEPVSKQSLQFEAYPNPSSTKVNLSIGKSSLRFVDMVVTDVLGNKVIQLIPNQSLVTIDISDLPKGIYIVRGLDENRTAFSGKIVKN
jgi:hypothetical protein